MPVDSGSAAPLYLVCTVGGSPEPLVYSILRYRGRPLRVHFIGSVDSLQTVRHERAVTTRELPCPVCGRPAHSCQDQTGIVERLSNEGFDLDPSRYETLELADPEDLSSCVEIIQRRIGPAVADWLRRDPRHEVGVDITGGTKCMSAALMLVARQWPCHVSYVGGTERTKGGVGLVVSGRERFVQCQNPWDALGYQVAEEAMTLANGGEWAAAARRLDEAARRVTDPHKKRSLYTLHALTAAFGAWDRFEHEKAAHQLHLVTKNQRDLDEFLGITTATALLRTIARYGESLGKLARTSGPSRELIADLLGNAQRRQQEGRFDDAVARLYRVIEAIAQFRLDEAYGIANTAKVAVEKLPVTWREQAGRPFALQDDYRLLSDLGDPLGQRFRSLGLSAEESRSALAARNLSVLAHGFQPIGERVCGRLWDSALGLAEEVGIGVRDLPVFPRLEPGWRSS